MVLEAQALTAPGDLSKFLVARTFLWLSRDISPHRGFCFALSGVMQKEIVVRARFAMAGLDDTVGRVSIYVSSTLMDAV